MKKNWVIGFAAAILLIVSGFTANAQRSGFSVYGPHGSVSVNVGGGGGYGPQYGGGYNRGYRRVYQRPQPPCNDNRYYSYNNCRPQPRVVYYDRGYQGRRYDDRRHNNGYAYNGRGGNGHRGGYDDNRGGNGYGHGGNHHR